MFQTTNQLRYSMGICFVADKHILSRRLECWQAKELAAWFTSNANLSWQCERGCYCMWKSWCCLRELDIARSLCVLYRDICAWNCPWYSLLCCVDDGPLHSGALVLSLSSRSINAPVVIKEWESMLSRLEQLAQDIRKVARCPPLLQYVTYRKMSNEDVIRTNEGPDRVTKVCKM